VASDLGRLFRHRFDRRHPGRGVEPGRRLRLDRLGRPSLERHHRKRSYKSIDAGKSWKHGSRETGNSGAVLIHPENPDLVYVAAIGNPFTSNPERGVYRSRDGGGSWENVLFLSDQTGAVDLEFAPDNPREIYAAMWRAERKPWTILSGGNEGGVYKSEDGGDTWTEL
jgi:hypothetical protein